MIEQIIEAVVELLNRLGGRSANDYLGEYREVNGQLREESKGRAIRLFFTAFLTLGLICLAFGCALFGWGSKMALMIFGLLTVIVMELVEWDSCKRQKFLRELAVSLENRLDPDKTRKMPYRDAPPRKFGSPKAAKIIYFLFMLLWLTLISGACCGRYYRSYCSWGGGKSHGGCSYHAQRKGVLPPGHLSIDTTIEGEAKK